MKMIEVLVNGISYTIWFEKLKYHLKEDNQSIFQSEKFEDVREKLLTYTGV